MSQNTEVLIEGTYSYLDGETNYSQENFKLLELPEKREFHIHSEIVSRLESGEFFKILVHFAMNQHFVPYAMKIEKSIGQKYAVEQFEVNLGNQELKYTFQNAENSQHFTKPINSKHYLTAPAFATSAIFTLSKKMDASGRSPVILISSANEWDYISPPTEKVIFAEYKNRDLTNFKLNDVKLPASHLCLYEHDSIQSGNEQPVEIFVSKHFAIPYQMIHGNQKIVIKNLKKY